MWYLDKMGILVSREKKNKIMPLSEKFMELKINMLS